MAEVDDWGHVKRPGYYRTPPNVPAVHGEKAMLKPSARRDQVYSEGRRRPSIRDEMVFRPGIEAAQSSAAVMAAPALAMSGAEIATPSCRRR